MNGVAEFVRALGPGRLAAMGAVAAGLIGCFVFLMLRLSQPQHEEFAAPTVWLPPARTAEFSPPIPNSSTS